jgi:sugar phosphate isomerase/epimerase
MYSRREFGQVILAGMPLAFLFRGNITRTANGVRLGAITFSFHDLPNIAGLDHVDGVIEDCKGCGVGLIELMCNHVEPVSEYQVQAMSGRGRDASPGGGGGRGGARGTSLEALKARDDLRQWRLSTPMSHFVDIKNKFDAAGIVLYAYCVNGMGADFTDEEIDKMFEQAKTLGVATISTSTTLDVAQKLVPFVERHKFTVAFHGHDDVTDPNQFATPGSFHKAMTMSKYFRINLDVGHFVAANFDPIPFIQENHERITHIHMKDRMKNHGAELPWGQGQTPIKEVLILLKEHRYPIPVEVELAYPVPVGSNCVQEVAKCMAYMKQSLA